MKIRFFIAAVTAISCISIVCAGCRREENVATSLQVVTTLFPLFDFASAIAGGKANVTMLLPPGVEPHTFEPRPEDMIRIRRAGLFIYTSKYMEPWAERIIAGVDSRTLRIVNSGDGIDYRESLSGDRHGTAAQNRKALDPHFWLDFANASLMVDTILAGFVASDPANAENYRQNAAILKKRLNMLDERYRHGLSSCLTRKILHGGHYTFGYMAHRYGLEYQSLSGISSDSEPSAERMASLVREIRKSGFKYLFAEELLSPRLSETLAQEAGVGVLMLHGAHNLAKDELLRNTSFITLMERNLVNLQKGLQCSGK